MDGYFPAIRADTGEELAVPQLVIDVVGFLLAPVFVLKRVDD